MALSSLPLRQNKVVLVIDLVESVRLMAANEPQVVAHWRHFLQHARDEVLPRCGGRLVKSLGDGLLAEFDRPAEAVHAALDLQRFFAPTNHDLPTNEQLHLRAGINATHLYADAHDVYGHGVNLAARIADLAGPGETVVTDGVRDEVVDGFDGDVEDMGESYLKHWPEPVRTWRIRPVSTGSGLPSCEPSPGQGAETDFRPSIAVIPFVSRSQAAEHFVIGDLIADGVIAQLAQSQGLRVISRLSTSAFRGRDASTAAIDTRLDAAFALSGSYVVLGERVMIMAELTDTRRHEVIWAERLSGNTMDLLQDHSELLHHLAWACADNLLHAEVKRSLTQALPRLDSNALMLGGITLMHRSTRRDLERSFQLIEAVVDRHKRVATPWAWLAKWHIMQVVLGLAAEPAKAFQRAIDIADRALDLEPDSSLAMAIKGHALCHLGSDVDGSHRLLQQAHNINPNDAMAWLYSSVWSVMWNEGKNAIPEAERALSLSPLDPLRFYYEMSLGGCYASTGQWDLAIETCRSSLRLHRYQPPTLRSLLLAQFESGRVADAQATLAELRALDPGMTIARYLSVGRENHMRRRIANAMADLGVPLN